MPAVECLTDFRLAVLGNCKYTDLTSIYMFPKRKLTAHLRAFKVIAKPFKNREAINSINDVIILNCLALMHLCIDLAFLCKRRNK